MHSIHLIQLKNVPIFEQLQLEEALLRADERSWCIINRGSPPAIVMGISGKVQEHIDQQKQIVRPIPVIRRFSGGGTVFIDEATNFYSLIGNKSVLDRGCTPENLLKWTETLYAPAFEGMDFSLRENDYVIGTHKFGGNAQYICKDRWLHHTSFLWDYSQKNMEHLLIPPKMPTYRKKRPHGDFLCCLKNFFLTEEHLQKSVLGALKKSFKVVETPLKEAMEVLSKDHRKATKFV